MAEDINTLAGVDYDGGVLVLNREYHNIAYYARKPEDPNVVDPSAHNIFRSSDNVENGTKKGVNLAFFRGCDAFENYHFYDDESLKILARCGRLYIDSHYSCTKGTPFQAISIIWSQQTYKNNTFSLPLRFCLLKKENTESLNSMLTKIKSHLVDLGLAFSPKYIHVDFDLAQIKSFDNFFENGPQLILCYFHFN